MEIYAFHWPIMPLIDLNDVLRPEIVEFDLLIVRAGSNAVAKGVELDLMDHSSVFLIGLDGLLGREVPNVNQLIVAGDQVRGGWRKLAVPDPIVVLF
jgi:hypothetical protein